MAIAPAIITPAQASLTTALATSIRIGPATFNASTRDQTLTVAAGGLTTVVITTTNPANPGAQVLQVSALPAALPSGARFYMGSVLVVLTAAALAAAITLSVQPLSAGIGSTVGTYFSLAVNATATAIPANTWFTFSNGTKAKTIADAALGATLLNLQYTIGTPVAANTSSYNLFPVIPGLTAVNVSLPSGSVTSVQYFGQAVGVQAKAGLTPQNITFASTGSDVDPGVSDLAAAAFSAAAPASTRGFIISMADGRVFWGYADIADFTPDTSSPTNILANTYNLAVREIYPVIADAA